MWVSCVGRLCVGKLCVREGRREEGGRTEVHNQEQEPHTMMWGTNCWPMGKNFRNLDLDRIKSSHQLDLQFVHLHLKCFRQQPTPGPAGDHPPGAARDPQATCNDTGTQRHGRKAKLTGEDVHGLATESFEESI